MWNNNDRWTYNYDANNNKVEELHQIGSSSWDNYQRDRFTYDTDNNLVIQYTDLWNNTAYSDYMRYLGTYDANGNRLVWDVQGWDGSVWGNWGRYTNTYSATSQLLSESEYTWSFADVDWEGVTQSRYNYNAQGLRDTIFEDSWVAANSAFEKFTRKATVYNTYSQGTFQLDESWNGAAWENSARYYYYYELYNDQNVVPAPADPANLVATGSRLDMVSNIILTWTDNSTDEEGFIIWRTDNINTTPLTILDSVGANITTYQDDVNPDVIYWYGVTAYNASGLSDTSNIDSAIAIITGINETVPGNSVTVYPNPFSSEVKIEFTAKASSVYTLEIFDIKGSKVYSTSRQLSSGQQSVTWNGNNAAGRPVSPSSYFYRLTDGTRVIKGRLIKQ
jgi:hypothetical protein